MLFPRFFCFPLLLFSRRQDPYPAVGIHAHRFRESFTNQLFDVSQVLFLLGITKG